jgi:hypothetical protein
VSIVRRMMRDFFMTKKVMPTIDRLQSSRGRYEERCVKVLRTGGAEVKMTLEAEHTPYIFDAARLHV